MSQANTFLFVYYVHAPGAMSRLHASQTEANIVHCSYQDMMQQLQGFIRSRLGIHHGAVTVQLCPNGAVVDEAHYDLARPRARLSVVIDNGEFSRHAYYKARSP